MLAIVNVVDTSIPDGVAQIVEQLPRDADLPSLQEVALRFSHDFVYLTGLVLLAAWRKSLPAGIKVKVEDKSCSPQTQKFLINTGFREIIETGTDHPSALARIGRVPIQPIVGGWTTEATVTEVCRIFDEYAGHVKDTQPFRVLLSELCENVLAHSELTTPGYICARVLEPINKCEIAIADTGIGIEQSFQQGTNTEAMARISAGTSSLQIALDGFSSSKPKPRPGTFRSHYGFGLYITRRLVEDNRGRLTLISGRESRTVERYDQKKRTLQRPWKGTFVGIVLDMVNPLPLSEVYGEIDKLVVGEPAQDERLLKPPVPAEVAETRVNLSNYGSQLLTREAGTSIRADIASLLAAGKVVRVGLDGLEDITPS
ncbi:MAG: ATP-binding protein, partial [bacterium]